MARYSKAIAAVVAAAVAVAASQGLDISEALTVLVSAVGAGLGVAVGPANSE